MGGQARVGAQEEASQLGTTCENGNKASVQLAWGCTAANCLNGCRVCHSRTIQGEFLTPAFCAMTKRGADICLLLQILEGVQVKAVKRMALSFLSPLC